VREIRKALANRVPLIGFSGSPFTLACYMIEGGGSDDFRRVKTMLYARPDLLHRVLAVNADAVADFLTALSKGTPITPNLCDGMKDMQVLEAGILSSARGCKVAVSDVK